MATEALNRLSDAELSELSYDGGKISTLHKTKEEQVRNYAVEILATRKAEDHDDKRPLTLFALTFVVDRFIVTNVEVL